MLEEYLNEQAEREQLLQWRYPWAPLVYNWIITITVVALAVSFVIWGLDIRTERRAADMTAMARAAWEADRLAEETAAAEELAAVQASQEFVMKQEATSLAKMFYGIRRFDEKYGYSDKDFETYARCAFNRYDAGNGVNSLAVIISRPQQFLGYDDGNQVIDEYYNLALRFVEQWHTEETKPCDVSYQWAELTPDGIYLKNDINADGYARRWRA